MWQPKTRPGVRRATDPGPRNNPSDAIRLASTPPRNRNYDDSGYEPNIFTLRFEPGEF